MGARPQSFSNLMTSSEIPIAVARLLNTASESHGGHVCEQAGMKMNVMIDVMCNQLHSD